MNATELQIQIFQAIKSRLASYISLVDEIAGVLNISTDSAYRRIRGEKPLTLDDVYTLCTHYQLSLDGMLNQNSDAFIFKGQFVDPTTFQFQAYLSNAVQQVKYINSFAKRKLYYLCKDIPIFYHFQFKELAAFKYFFWLKAFINHPDFENKKFSFADYPDELFELGKKSLYYYNTIDSVEIWNIENIISTIRQIEFYREMNLFSNEEDVYTIYQSLERLFLHLEKQADAGYKFDVTDPAQKPMGTFQMYYNEMIIGDNSILAIMDGSKMAFIAHNIINFMSTRDVAFCDKMHENLQNLTRRSTLISEVSERERARFFKFLQNRITTKKENLKA